jgi:hypothetical protein
MGSSNVDFLREKIVPFFSGTINKNIISTIYDLDGNIVLITDLHARLWGYLSHKELIGKSLSQLEKIVSCPEIVTQLERVRQIVIRREMVITSINFFHYKDSMVMLFCYHFPFFSPDGKVIATRVVGEPVNLFKHSVEVNQQFKPDGVYENKIAQGKLNIKLTNREKEILYLLKIGFSQSDAATYLGISRGALVKTISTKICPQFCIRGSNTKLLIKRVIESKYFDSIPDSLINPKVIILESDFEHLL